MSFVSPAWLLGLLLVPLIWYVHRSGPILRRHPVSSVLPWRRSQEASLDAGVKRRADPAWLWRALAAALLSVALARPRFEHDSAPVTLWIDDSVSMQTVETGRSRLDTALDQARERLKLESDDAVELRRLSRPWQSMSMRDAATIDAASAEPTPPPGELLDPAREHWLITDGADDEINEWLRSAPIAHVIQVSRIERNVGITSAAARPQPDASGRIAVEAVVSNGGNVRERRRVSLQVADAPPVMREVELEPGTSRTVSFTLDSRPTGLAFELAPQDALVQDDSLQLETGPLQAVKVRVDDGCAAAIVKAVSAHPSLQLSMTSDAKLDIRCEETRTAELRVPTIRFTSGATAPLAAGRLMWAPRMDAARRIDTGDLPKQARGRLESPRPDDVVLLTAGETPLIIRRDGSPRLVEIALDVGPPSIGRSEAFPLLMALLADEALGRPLLQQLVAVDRGHEASNVAAPSKLSVTGNSHTRVRAAAPIALSPLILLALLLLAWDAWTLLRRFVRDRHEQWTPAA